VAQRPSEYSFKRETTDLLFAFDPPAGSVNRNFHVGDTGRHPRLSAHIIQNRFGYSIKGDRCDVRRHIGHSRRIACGQRKIIHFPEGIHELHQGRVRNLCLFLSRGPRVRSPFIEGRSVTMNFDPILGTRAETAASAKRDSQRIPIADFRKRDVCIRKLAERENADGFPYRASTGCPFRSNGLYRHVLQSGARSEISPPDTTFALTAFPSVPTTTSHSHSAAKCSWLRFV